jgi:hypothetical protein
MMGFRRLTTRAAPTALRAIAATAAIASVIASPPAEARGGRSWGGLGGSWHAGFGQGGFPQGGGGG